MNILDSLPHLNRLLHERSGVAFIDLSGMKSSNNALAVALSQPPKLLEVLPPRAKMIAAEDIGTTNRWLKHPGDPVHLINSHARTS